MVQRASMGAHTSAFSVALRGEKHSARTAGFRSERGSGTVLAVVILGVIVALVAVIVVVGGASVAHRRAAAAADLAALGAADAAVGRVAGEPCAVARALAHANGAALSDCEVVGVVVRVRARVAYAGLDTSASARAGPPGSP